MSPGLSWPTSPCKCCRTFTFILRGRRSETVPLVCAPPSTEQASCLEDAKETSSGIYSQLCRVISAGLPPGERSSLQILGNRVVPCFLELVSVASCPNINPGLFFYFQSTANKKTSKKDNVDTLDTKRTSPTSRRHLPAALTGEPEKSPLTSSQGTATKFMAKSSALPKTKKKL